MQPLRIPSNSSTSPPPSPRLQEHPKDEAMERVDQVAQDSLIRTETPTLSPIVEGVEQRRLSADSLAILFEQQLQLQWILKRNESQAHENMLTGIELFDPANPGSIGVHSSKVPYLSSREIVLIDFRDFVEPTVDRSARSLSGCFAYTQPKRPKRHCHFCQGHMESSVVRF